MADTTEKAGGLLDARKAKAVFCLGAGLFLLMVFWDRASGYKLKQVTSEGMQTQAARMHEVEKPRAPSEPVKPPEKAKDVGSLNNKYDELKKEYDKKKKEYDEELLPKYQKEAWLFEWEEQQDLNEDGEELERKAKWIEATRDNWAYWVYVGRFIASVLMLIGLGFTALNGNEWERAAAIVVVGLVLLGTNGTLF